MYYKDLIKMQRYPHSWCPGCGIGSVLKNTAKVLAGMNLDHTNTIAVSGIGCSGRMAGYLNMDAVHSLHGRALTSAEAIKTVRPQHNVVVLSGDGDLFSIGGNHFLHTARRDPDITVVCNNNEIYGLTAGQYSPTTPKGTYTTTSPKGCKYEPIDIHGILRTMPRYFYARSTVWHVLHMQKCIQEAIQWKGFAFVDVVSDCIEINGRHIGYKKASEMFAMYKEKYKIVRDVEVLGPHDLGVVKKE
ncbi:MAG: 2-oxoacid:ferredoxin oxidoreductase subunit beta [Euryarchaeota archaeon]|nr:2-oxoacid:ferredoxin oxidoreductase subunit beta [Euryarchaeota archaeon]